MVDLNNNQKDDLEEIKAGFAQLVRDAEQLNGAALLQDLKNGVTWTENYITGLCDEAQKILSAVVTKVKAESQTLGEAVANALTLLNNPALHSAFGAAQSTIEQLVAIGSDLLTKLLSLVTGLQAAAGAL